MAATPGAPHYNHCYRLLRRPMNRTTLLFVALATLAGAAAPAATALPQAVGETPLPSLSPMIKRVAPAIVSR